MVGRELIPNSTFKFVTLETGRAEIKLAHFPNLHFRNLRNPSYPEGKRPVYLLPFSSATVYLQPHPTNTFSFPFSLPWLSSVITPPAEGERIPTFRLHRVPSLFPQDRCPRRNTPRSVPRRRETRFRTHSPRPASPRSPFLFDSVRARGNQQGAAREKTKDLHRLRTTSSSSTQTPSLLSHPDPVSTHVATPPSMHLMSLLVLRPFPLTATRPLQFTMSSSQIVSNEVVKAVAPNEVELAESEAEDGRRKSSFQLPKGG